MTKLKIDDVEIRSFRGIKQYDLIFDQKSLVFCGANGTGKSSFVNAIEYLFTGKVENLSGIGDVDHKKSIVHKGDDPNDLLVRAYIGEHTIERSLKDGLKCDDELMDLKRDFENGSFILNRKKLLSFIESTPRIRYDRITELISYKKYDKIEDKLRWVSKSINKQLKAKENELKATENELKGIYNCDIKDVEDEINAVLEKNNIETITKDTDKKEFVKKFTKKEEFDEEIIDELSDLNNAYLNLLDEYENIALNEFKSANALLSLLKKSEEFIQSESPSECPICHSEIDNEIILADIKGKIMDLQEKNNELNNWKSEAKDLINGLKELDYRLKDFDLRNIIKDLEDLSNFNRKITEMDKKTLPEIKIKIT